MTPKAGKVGSATTTSPLGRIQIQQIAGGRPHDHAAIALGKRWFMKSGADVLRMCSSASYQTLCATPRLHLQGLNGRSATDRASFAKAREPVTDLRQIDKDVLDGRTTADCLSPPSLKRYLSQLQPDSIQVMEKLIRILSAFTVRNPHLGYVQSMNMLALFLLAFLSEEETFWVLCALVEGCRPVPHFYSTQPTDLYGCIIQLRVTAELAQGLFPKVQASMIDRGFFLHIFETEGIKWLLSCLVDTLPLGPQIFLMDRLLCQAPNQGGWSLTKAILFLIQESALDLSRPIDADEEHTEGISILRETAACTSLETWIRHFGRIGRSPRSARLLSPTSLTALVEKHTWSEELERPFGLPKLSSDTGFSLWELKRYAKSYCCYRELFCAPAPDLTKMQFHTILLNCDTDLDLTSCYRLFQVMLRLSGQEEEGEYMSFQGLIKAISLLQVKTSFKKKMKLCFQVFDADGDGFLDRNEQLQLAMFFDSALSKLSPVASPRRASFSVAGLAAALSWRTAVPPPAADPHGNNRLRALSCQIAGWEMGEKPGKLSFQDFYNGVKVQPQGFRRVFKIKHNIFERSIGRICSFGYDALRQAEIRGGEVLLAQERVRIRKELANTIKRCYLLPRTRDDQTSSPTSEGSVLQHTITPQISPRNLLSPPGTPSLRVSPTIGVISEADLARQLRHQSPRGRGRGKSEPPLPFILLDRPPPPAPSSKPIAVPTQQSKPIAARPPHPTNPRQGSTSSLVPPDAVRQGRRRSQIFFSAFRSVLRL